MAGLILKAMDAEIKQREAALNAELVRRAVAQGVVDNAAEAVVRDILPLTDIGGSTTNSTSASGGYRYEEWRADLRTYQQDASTASAANSYNTVVNCDMNKQKVIGFVGVAKKGEDSVAAIRFSLGSGTKIKDIWQIGGAPEDAIIYAENPILYNSTNKVKIEFYLKSVAIVYHQLIGKAAEPKGNTIIGAE